MADIATLGLIVKAESVDEANRKLKDLGDQATTTERKAESLGRTMARAGTAIAGAWITRQVIQNTIEAQNAIAVLDARIRSTGGAAGRSRVQLEAMAASLQKVTTYGDEAIMSAQAMLMTFKQIKGDEFDRATKMTLDLAAAMGGDATSAALQLGKALEDPETGLTALRRSGISFTEAQREQIKAMMDMGKVAEAQTLILNEMEKQVGGTATALRDTLGGALAGLKNDFGDLLEANKDATRDIVLLINTIAALIRKLNELRGVIGNLLPAAPNNPALSWLMGRFGGGVGGGGGQSQAVEDTTYLIPLMDTLSVTIKRVADAHADAATEAENLLRLHERLVRIPLLQLWAPVGAGNAKLTANRGYQTGSNYWMGQMPTPRMYGSFGGGGGAGRGVNRQDYASAVFGGMGGTGRVLDAAMVGGVQGAAVAITGALASMVQEMASSAQRAREAARLMRVALAEYGGALTEAIRGLEGNPVEQIRVQVQRQLEALWDILYPGKYMGQFGLGAKTMEDLVAELNALMNTTKDPKAIQAYAEALAYLGALINKQREAEAAAAYEQAKAMEENERRMKEAADELAKEMAEKVARAMEEAAEAARRFYEATVAIVQSLTERGLRLTGQGPAADMFALRWRHTQERMGMAGQSPDVLALLDFVQGMEITALQNEQLIGAIQDNLELQTAALQDQATAAQEAWEKQDAAYADQIEIAEAQLRVQEQTVDALRKVVENLSDFRQSLLTSNLTTLSPAAQLDAARAEFQRLTGLAMAGDVNAGQALSGSARTFLEASRGYNASGMGYATDFATVQAVLAQAEARFRGQLSVEEQMLNALQAQIAQLEARREEARQQYESQIAALQEQMRKAQEDAAAQIAAIEEAARKAAEDAQRQLEALLEQIRILTTVGTYITDQEGGGIPPDIKPDLLVIAQNTAASVSVFQAGLSTLAASLDMVKAEVAGLRSDTRRGMEANF